MTTNTGSVSKKQICFFLDWSVPNEESLASIDYISHWKKFEKVYISNKQIWKYTRAFDKPKSLDR